MHSIEQNEEDCFYIILAVQQHDCLSQSNIGKESPASGV